MEKRGKDNLFSKPKEKPPITPMATDRQTLSIGFVIRVIRGQV
jgi:hypothetical protein